MSDQEKNWSAYHSSGSGDDSLVEDSNELGRSVPLTADTVVRFPYDNDYPYDGNFYDGDVYVAPMLDVTRQFDTVHVSKILTIKGVNVFDKLSELEEKLQAVLQVVESLDLDISEDPDEESVIDDSDFESIEVSADTSYSGSDLSSDETNDSDNSDYSESSFESSSESDSDPEEYHRPLCKSGTNIVLVISLIMAIYAYLVQRCSISEK